MTTYTFEIDGIDLPPPIDWQDLETELKRDFDKRTISVQYSTTATYGGAGYAYLSEKYAELGHCGEAAVVITETCGGVTTRVVTGRIVLADCKWSLDRCTVECSIVDDGLGARIHNNAKIAVSPTAALSKSLVSITPCVPIALTAADTSNADLTGTRRAFDWFDAITHAIAFITDGTVSVESDWYTALPDGERYCFAVGSDLRTAGTAVTRVSYTFEDLFQELAKKYDLWMHPADDGSGGAVLRIEPGTTFFGDAGTLDLGVNPKVVRQLDRDRLFATVKVGSSEFIREMQTANPLPYISLLGFTEEVMNFEGQCNTDAELDLVTSWIIDPNILVKVTVGGDDGWDDEMFLIQYVGSTSRMRMAQYVTPGTGAWLHNEALLNGVVLSRYPLRSAVGAQIGSGDANSFLAINTSQQTEAKMAAEWAAPVGTILHPYVGMFDDDYTSPAFDVSNAWGNGTPQGLPVSAADSRFSPTVQGMYSFNVSARWRVYFMRHQSNTIPSVRIGVRARVYDAFDNMLYEAVQFGYWTTSTLMFVIEDLFSFSLVVDVTNYVTFELFASRSLTTGYPFPPSAEQGTSAGLLPPGVAGVELEVMAGATAACTAQINAVRVEPSVPDRITAYDLTKSITAQQWRGMVEGPAAAVTFDTMLGHVKTAKRRLYGGSTEFSIITT